MVGGRKKSRRKRDKEAEWEEGGGRRRSKGVWWRSEGGRPEVGDRSEGHRSEKGTEVGGRKAEVGGRDRGRREDGRRSERGRPEVVDRSTGSRPLSKEYIISANEETPLPPWISDEDIEYYASSFDKSGFTGPINYYRCLDLNWELLAPWAGAQVKVPTKFIVGESDLTYHYPGIKDYLHKGGFKQDVPFLEEVVVVQGAGHFVQQENAQEISDHIYNFFTKF
ncbi:hypothetical protein LUZ61_006596 [Rhynchospora tenuis]|uniref:Epoxide hydrolase n=1 Tax=Rhynchospora tenuis TaxID=198213 RepID=A0AAD5ZRY0_9POAL|nr:hypothetical protein LUZ61_006596 [Rhynchospora tenuis]